MRPIVLVAALVLALAPARPARAATVPYRTDGELIALATRVVRGRVLDSVAERTTAGAIRTRTRLAVLEDFTGGTDRLITVYELGGVLADGSAMSVPGSPRFARGDDVVLCLEPVADGFRTVALAFSAFRVGATAAGATPLTRMAGDLSVVGRLRPQAPVQQRRTLESFRATAAGVVGRASRLVVSAGDAASMVASASAAATAPYTLLGGGIRWREADSGIAIKWYRNTLTPSPIVGADTDTEIRTALAGWTNPTGASITLTFAGTKLAAVGPDAEPFCTPDNLGSGVLTFGDPRNELPVGVLAIGGGCSTSDTHVVNGQAFESFTHGFIVFNDTQALSGFTSAPNITRILEHEIGHTIGLGHTCEGDACTAGDAVNIMYPACCLAQTPIPPALGPDDLAGLVFIYPVAAPPSCTLTLSAPQPGIWSAGTNRFTFTVGASTPTCAWTASTSAPWLTLLGRSAGAGPGEIQVEMAPNIAHPQQRTASIAVGQATVTLTQAADGDGNGDGLYDAWALYYGLDGSSPDNSPTGDPDGDGVSNLAEQAAGTHPRGTVKRYLAEGAVNGFFDTEIALFNPGLTSEHVLLRFQPQGGAEIAWPLVVPSRTRRTISTAMIKSLTTGSFSTLIESDANVVVDRTMRWDATGYGSSAETAVESPSTTWYLAEGSTSTDFVLFYLLQNPGDVAATVTVRFLRPAPQPPIDRSYTVPPRSRVTIPVDTAAPELASTDVSGIVTSTQPIVVERAMYLNLPGQPFGAGHESAGVTAPATSWFMAEGATGTFFDLFVLIENPGTQAATVQVDYLLPTGAPLTKSYTVAPQSRFTIYVDDEQIPAGSGMRPLASTSVAMRVTSTNGVPIIVERSMWWPQPRWYEAHNAPATTVTGTTWALAGGYVGGANSAETYVLIANTSATAGTARVWVCLETAMCMGKEFALPAESRTNVPLGVEFPGAAGQPFSILVESIGDTPVPIVVERAMYDSPGGVTWAAGTAEVATRITP